MFPQQNKSSIKTLVNYWTHMSTPRLRCHPDRLTIRSRRNTLFVSMPRDAQVTNQGLWSAFQGGRLLVVCSFASENARHTRRYNMDLTLQGSCLIDLTRPEYCCFETETFRCLELCVFAQGLLTLGAPAKHMSAVGLLQNCRHNGVHVAAVVRNQRITLSILGAGMQTR